MCLFQSVLGLLVEGISRGLQHLPWNVGGSQRRGRGVGPPGWRPNEALATPVHSRLARMETPRNPGFAAGSSVVFVVFVALSWSFRFQWACCCLAPHAMRWCRLPARAPAMPLWAGKRGGAPTGARTTKDHRAHEHDRLPTIPRRIVCSAARWPNLGSPRIVVGSARMYGCPKKNFFLPPEDRPCAEHVKTRQPQDPPQGLPATFVHAKTYQPSQPLSSQRRVSPSLASHKPATRPTARTASHFPARKDLSAQPATFRPKTCKPCQHLPVRRVSLAFIYQVESPIETCRHLDVFFFFHTQPC